MYDLYQNIWKTLPIKYVKTFVIKTSICFYTYGFEADHNFHLKKAPVLIRLQNKNKVLFFFTSNDSRVL